MTLINNSNIISFQLFIYLKLKNIPKLIIMVFTLHVHDQHDLKESKDEGITGSTRTGK